MTDSQTKEITTLGDSLLGKLMGREVCRDAYTMALNCIAVLREKGIELEDWPALILIDGTRESLWQQVDHIDKEIADLAKQMGDDALAETADRRLNFRRENEKTVCVDVVNEIMGGLSEAFKKHQAWRKERDGVDALAGGQNEKTNA